MSRNPFVWDMQVRREVLDEEMARLRDVPYTLWKDKLRSPISKVVSGRDNRPYRVTVTADLLADGSGDIRVTLSLAPTSLLRRGVLRQDFVITKDNRFRV